MAVRSYILQKRVCSPTRYFLNHIIDAHSLQFAVSLNGLLTVYVRIGHHYFHLISSFSMILALSVGNFSSQPRKRQPLDLGLRRLLEPQTPSERSISPSLEPSEPAEYLWKERQVESFILTLLDVGTMTMMTEGISLECIHSE